MGTVVIVALIVFGVVGMSAYKQIMSETRHFFESPSIAFSDERALPPATIENKEPIILFSEPCNSVILMLPEKSA